MVGILSISDEEGFGPDTTRFGDVYRINVREYEVVRMSVTVCAAVSVSSIRGKSSF
jgi:hypothetical protein